MFRSMFMGWRSVLPRLRVWSHRLDIRLFGAHVVCFGMGALAVGCGNGWLWSAPTMAQTMGATSTSTGSISILVVPTGLGLPTYGSRNLNVINQAAGGLAGGFFAPSFAFLLPEVPNPIIPDIMINKINP
jgi:hypothetical protein